MEDENVLISLRFKEPVILGYGSSANYCYISEDRMWTIEKTTTSGFELVKKYLLTIKEDMRITEVQLIKPKIFEPAY